MTKIYLDHASSTETYPEVLDLMNGIASELFANPSSVHSLGRDGKSKIDEARISVARTLGVGIEEVIFTSGATESVFLAMVGSFLARKKAGTQTSKILISPVSHSCIKN